MNAFLQNGGIAVRAVAAFTTAFIGISPALAGTAEHSMRFGRFELVEEVRTRDPGEPPIMHVATEWTKYHLRWHSADGTARFVLTDDGEKVSASFDLRDCGSVSPYEQFSGQVGEPLLFRAARRQLGKLSRLCPRVAAVERPRYAHEFSSAADDFMPAIEALKQRGAHKFGSWRNRCVGRTAGFDPFAPCIMPNQKKN